MTSDADISRTSHLDNLAENLQLIADLGYGDAALAVADEAGSLAITADARPNTAVAPMPSPRIGTTLIPAEEPEAFSAFAGGAPVVGSRVRVARGIKYTTAAHPIGTPPYAVVIRDQAEQVAEAPGAMETAFMDAAEELLAAFSRGPLLDVRTGEPFSTTRRAGDGVMRVNSAGVITYASPNAVNIMRLTGVEGGLVGAAASTLAGNAEAIAPVLGSGKAAATEVAFADRVLGYRAIALAEGALVLVEDVTEARRREQELKVKDATIREVHHRVKNNLQTIASLLRIQARRTCSEEARHALAEATERVGSMAVVHDLLAGSDEERIDFAEAAEKVVSLVTQGLLGEQRGVTVTVEGTTGAVSAQIATSLALALAELVHNAIEHGLAGGADGGVTVGMRRYERELALTVRDTGAGLPADFDLGSSANLGLAIVRTVVEDDLRGTLTFSSARGTAVTVRVPLPRAEEGEGA